MTQIPSQESAATEPLVTVGSITAGVTALITLLIAFGLPLSGDQQTAILGLVAVAAPLAVMAVGRSRVWSPATVARLMQSRR